MLGKGAGGNGQMRIVAEALGWPYVEKRMAYNPLGVLPNLLRGASRIGFDVRNSDPLAPPWPDLVIGASRRSAPVALHLKRRCGALCVHLLHVQAPLSRFDLIATMPQYRLPERSNVLHLSGALNRIPEARLLEGAERWEPLLAHLPRPWIGLIVGGSSSSYNFDPNTAARLGREASALARREGGSLLISTTPRTSAASTRALFDEVDVPAYRYAFAADDPENPYTGFIALADRFVVTADSASLPMEACQMGRPVQVFDWPRKRSGLRVAGRTITRFHDAAVSVGLLKPARDFDAYHRGLRECGITSRLSEPPRTPTGTGADLEELVARVRELMRARGRRPDGTVLDVG